MLGQGKKRKLTVVAVLLLIGLAAVLLDACSLPPWPPGSGSGLSPDVGLTGISMVAADEGWAVGYTVNERDLTSRPLMLDYTRGFWTEVAVPASLDPRTLLASVSMVSAKADQQV